MAEDGDERAESLRTEVGQVGSAWDLVGELTDSGEQVLGKRVALDGDSGGASQLHAVEPVDDTIQLDVEGPQLILGRHRQAFRPSMNAYGLT